MPTTVPCPALYKQHYLDKGYDLSDLWRKIAARYDIHSALYPGSFVDISPSFSIERVVYVDSYRKARPFFADPGVLAYIRARKEYPAEPSVTFHPSDYTSEFGEDPGSHDLLISQYAGFISTPCKVYLKVGGILVANDSHGDASMAHLDPDYRLIAVANRRGERFSISEKGLERYFVPKREVEITPELLRERGKGIAYTRRASNYIFRRTK
jgi:hypothetical protein